MEGKEETMRAFSNNEHYLDGSGITRELAPPAFQVMLKPRGSICNLDCQYCFYLAKEQLYPGADFRMSDELLEEYTRQYIAAQRVPEVVFAWQGGEPTLMGLQFYRKAVALQHKYRLPGMRVLNALQTNGTRLDDNWCTFFHEQNFLVGLSLDGPRPLHDAYRAKSLDCKASMAVTTRGASGSPLDRSFAAISFRTSSVRSGDLISAFEMKVA